MQANPNVDMQTLHENYSRPFEITVKKGDPACIMAAYNMVNGTHCTENKSILGDILRTSGVGWVRGVGLECGPGRPWRRLDERRARPRDASSLGLHYPQQRSAAGTLTSATLTASATRVMNARTKFKDLDATYMASTASFSLAGATEAVTLAERTELEGASC